MAQTAKRTAAVREGVDRTKLYPLEEAVKMVKERAKAKFDETIEVAMNLGVDPRHADQMVRGIVNLPNGSGRSVRVAVFARGAKADEAKAAGADVVGAEDLVEKVQGGNIDFDRCIATPDLMPLVGRLGKVLGPRGMMPNPKVGTVTMDVTGAVKGAKGGSVEFRVEKAGIVQAGIGKASFAADKLVQNIKAFADAVQKAKPAGAKGTFINRVAISSTMGPGVKVEPASLFGAAIGCAGETCRSPGGLVWGATFGGGGTECFILWGSRDGGHRHAICNEIALVRGTAACARDLGCWCRAKGRATEGLFHGHHEQRHERRKSRLDPARQMHRKFVGAGPHQARRRQGDDQVVPPHGREGRSDHGGRARRSMRLGFAEAIRRCAPSR